LTLPIPDFIIEYCVPDCDTCPGIWKNELTEHWILCHCKRCGHCDCGNGYEEKFEHSKINEATFSHTEKTENGPDIGIIRIGGQRR